MTGLEIAGAPVRIYVKAAAVTDKGPTRKQNQDAFVFPGLVGLGPQATATWEGEISSWQTFAVVDGMGGAAGGAEAAAIVAVTLASKETRPAEIASSIRTTSLQVSEAGVAWGLEGMGATFAAVAIGPDGLVFTNVGDCRAYQYAGGFLGQVSIDDRLHPNASAVTQAIGASDRIDIHIWEQSLSGEGCRLVLCSDGGWSTLGEDRLVECLKADLNPVDAVKAACELACDLNSSDNFTFLIADLTFTR